MQNIGPILLGSGIVEGYIQAYSSGSKFERNPKLTEQLL
jgi:hypothetical protein